MITETQALILSMLEQSARGAFGSDLLRSSSGALKRGSIYAQLARLEKADLVTSEQEESPDPQVLPRTRYKITRKGSTARIEFSMWGGAVTPTQVILDS